MGRAPIQREMECATKFRLALPQPRGRAVRNFDEGGPASGGATRLGRDSIVALAALAREWVALNGIAVCAPRTYRSGRNGTSIARINGRSGVPFTSMRLPQQASSDTPRA